MDKAVMPGRRGDAGKKKTAALRTGTADIQNDNQSKLIITLPQQKSKKVF